MTLRLPVRSSTARLSTAHRRAERGPDLIEAAIAAVEPAREILARLEAEREVERAAARHAKLAAAARQGVEHS